MMCVNLLCLANFNKTAHPGCNEPGAKDDWVARRPEHTPPRRQPQWYYEIGHTRLVLDWDGRAIHGLVRPCANSHHTYRFGSRRPGHPEPMTSSRSAPTGKRTRLTGSITTRITSPPTLLANRDKHLRRARAESDTCSIPSPSKPGAAQLREQLTIKIIFCTFIR